MVNLMVDFFIDLQSNSFSQGMEKCENSLLRDKFCPYLYAMLSNMKEKCSMLVISQESI